MKTAKTIKTTHIDTGGHGYLSVSKKDFLRVLRPEQITHCSGHSISRMYLEEDCDASLFMNTAEAKGIKVEVKSGYNLKFDITHNYKPEMFHYQPKLGDEVELHDGGWYKIVGIGFHKMVVACMGTRYGISLSNPYKWVISARGLGVLSFKIDQIVETVRATYQTTNP